MNILKKTAIVITTAIAMTILSTGGATGCSYGAKYTLNARCVDSNGNPLVDTEISFSATQKDVVSVYATDSEGKFTVTNATLSTITFMIVTEEVTYKQEKKITAAMKKGGLLVVAFDI